MDNKKRYLRKFIRALFILVVLLNTFIIQSFIPTYSQNAPTCNGNVVVCPNGTNARCTNGKTGVAECRYIPGFGSMPAPQLTPGCNICTAFYPDEVVCVSSSGEPFTCNGSFPLPASLTSSTSTSSTSSTSSTTSGIVPTCSGSTPICANGTPACTNGRTGTVQCINISGTGLVPGCNTGTAIYPNDVACVSSITTSSSSSSSSGNIFFCASNMVFCTNGLNGFCTNSAFSPTCINTTPDCCIATVTSLSCNAALLTCVAIIPSTTTSSSSSSSGTTLGTDQVQNVNVDVVTNPTFPDVVQLPLISDQSLGRVGFAYIGSNPSYEIQLPTQSNLQFSSLDIKDSKGILFSNIPFSTTNITNVTDKVILSLTLPNNISKGEAKFTLKDENNNTFTGIIEIIEPTNLASINKQKQTEIPKPTILRLVTKKNKSQSRTIKLRGDGFVGSKVYLLNGPTAVAHKTSDKSPNTTVSILPTSLNSQITKRRVSKDRKHMSIIVYIPASGSGQILTRAVLTVTTPKGIVSSQFILKP